MNVMASGLRLKSGEWVQYTKVELIPMLAGRYGGSHADWSLPAGLIAGMDLPYRFLGMQPIALEMRGTSRTIQSLGQRFLAEYDKRRGAAIGDPSPSADVPQGSAPP